MNATESLTCPEPKHRLRSLYRFMAARCFIAGREELDRAGFVLTQIDSWLRTGRIVEVLRGVYSYGRDIDTRDAALRAALVAAGPGAALTGKSACEEWEIVSPKDGIPQQIDVVVTSGAARRLRGASPALRGTIVRVVKRPYRRQDIRRRNGLDLVCPALALIDFAKEATPREVRFAFLEACRLRLFGRRDVGFCFRRVSGRRGAAKLKCLLGLWVPELNRINSVLEGLFLLEWVERELVMPEVNSRIFGYEVDLYWRDRGLVLELDGNAFHSDPVQRAIDIEKQLELEARGLTVLRITYREFMADPEAAVNRVAHLLGLAGVPEFA